MNNQRIKLNLHKYRTAGVHQYDIDKLSDEDEDYDDQSSLSSLSDDDFSESESESYQDTTGSTGQSEATTDEMLWGRRRAPVCGVAAHSFRRQLLTNGPREPIVLAPSNRANYSSKPRMGIERELNTKEMYSQIRRGESSSQRPRDRYVPTRKQKLMHGAPDLSSIQEVSPIRSASFSTSNTSSEVPPMSSLRVQSEWKPQLTSTTTSFQKIRSPCKDDFDEDDDDHFKAPVSPVFSSTPRSQRLYRKHQKFGRHNSQFHLSDSSHLDSINDSRCHSRSESRTGSRMEGSTSQMSVGKMRTSSPDPWNAPNNENKNPCPLPLSGKLFHPIDFGLDNCYAKNRDVRGILFLAISLCGRVLTLNIQNAYYFRNAAQPMSVCSYVSAVLCRRSQSSSSNSRKYRQKPDEAYRTRLVTNSNCPKFDESFQFTFSDNCSRDVLVVTIYEMDSGNAEKKKLLGCMTFPVSKLLKKANQLIGPQFSNSRYDEPREEVEISNEGFYLLNKEQGSRKSFPQSKVKRRTFYEDPVLTGGASSASSVTSNHQNGGQMTTTSPRLSVPNELTMGDYYRTSANEMRGGRSTQNLLDYTTASSSTNGSMAPPEKLKFHRATLPSITTTNSEHNSDDAKSLSPERPPQDHHFLCPDDNGGVYGAGPAHSALKKSSVRRAASFTFSPKHSSSKTNLRHLNDGEKRRFLGPISRTLSYFRTKMDLALSTSSLYPSRDEVRQWETSFESLLNSKFGCALFRQFLKKEFSDENMDFWLECEEFKKMKDGKKSTTQKAIEIYTEFVAEHAPKEVNLDSDTRAATKAAVEGGCKPDTFALAQNRVEQLMSKDSYRRFLRDRLFLDLLESYDTGDKEPSSSKH